MNAGLDFQIALTQTLLRSINELQGSDNYDRARFGPERFGRSRALLQRIFRLLNLLLERGGYRIAASDAAAARYDEIARHIEGLSCLYGMLADAYSRRALVEVIAYRILGRRRMKLWTNTADYWKTRAIASSIPTHGKKLDTGIADIRLSLTDLRRVGYEVTLYTHPLAVTHQFLLNHYAYERATPPVRVVKDDYVIDAGAAWGDTALRFALEVGETGRVYSFEVEPRNIDILKRNLALNSHLSPRVSIVEKALWSSSGATLSFSPCGPGTRVSDLAKDREEMKVLSVSIDDFARLLPRVDFIKMDIEGAEPQALKGAEQTLRRHRPKMAISLYHNVSDFVDIPAYLASLDIDYNYYLDHGSIYGEETVLYVVPKKASGETVNVRQAASLTHGVTRL